MNKISIESHKKTLETNYILLLTSNEKEKNAINGIIENICRSDLSIPNCGCYIGKIGDNFVIHICGTSGISQLNSIARVAVNFIGLDKYPKPKFVVLTGFCWGDPVKVKIGQTLICTTIYSINKSVSKPEKIEYKATTFSSSLSMSTESLSRILPDITSLRLSLMASLETLLTSTSERDNITSQLPAIDGGEMEGFGFIPSIGEIPWLIVKTVSDFGCDSFDREQQTSTAETTANLLQGIIEAACEANHFLFNTSNDECLHLLDAMHGNSISINRSEINSDNLNDVLNDKYGPILHHKLSSYCSGLEYDSEFPYLACDLLLEMIQNAFKHNGSSTVSLTFNQASIVLTGNNEAYDITQILGENGGAKSWGHFKDKYISSNEITYNVKGNTHKFLLTKVDTHLRSVKDSCTAIIRPSSVRSSYSYDEGILIFDTSCNSIYVDTRYIRMTSRAISIIEDVKKILSEGRTVYLSCRNMDEAQRYKEAFSDHTELLRVLID